MKGRRKAFELKYIIQKLVDTSKKKYHCVYGVNIANSQHYQQLKYKHNKGEKYDIHTHTPAKLSTYYSNEFRENQRVVLIGRTK